MAIASTRLRFIKTKDIETLVDAIDSLPFKVEIKSIQKDGTKWVAIFVIPEQDGIEFKNLDLT